MKLVAGLLAVAAAGVITAPAAHADTNSYISTLQATGVPMLSGPFPAVQAGMTACSMIRDGVSPEAVAGQVAGLWSSVIGPRVVDAAQHELCPDTLR